MDNEFSNIKFNKNGEMVDYDPITGITMTYTYLPNGKMKVRMEQDVDSLLAHNQAEYNTFGKGQRFAGDSPMYKMASIPVVLADKWKREDGFDIKEGDSKELRKRLNDPDYKKLRTRPGRM